MSGSINAALLSLNRPNTRDDIPLRVKKKFQNALEHHEMYYGVPDDEVISLAAGRVKGVTDRATAVAVLLGPFGLNSGANL